MQGNLPLSNLILRIANPTLELSRNGLSIVSFTLAFGQSLFTHNLKFACCSGSSYLSLLVIQVEESESKLSRGKYLCVLKDHLERLPQISFPSSRGPWSERSFDSLPNLIFFPLVICIVLCGSWGSNPSTSVMSCGPTVRTYLAYSWQRGGMVEKLLWPAVGNRGEVGHWSTVLLIVDLRES